MIDWSGDRDPDVIRMMVIANDISVNEVFRSQCTKEGKKKKENFADNRTLGNTNMEGLGRGRVLLEIVKRKSQKVEIT